MTSGRNGVLAAAAAAGCAVGVLIGRLFLRRKWATEEMGAPKLRVPTELLGATNKYAAELELAVEVAVKAGKNMVHHCDAKGTADENSEDDLDISVKGSAADFATAVDLLNEKLIGDAISKRFPSHDIIGEELVGTGSPPPLTSNRTWIIDPIDGTTNFASGLPLTCVSIGLCDGGEPVMGVAYAPITNELYVAIKGKGAYRNGVRIFSPSSLSSTAAKKKTLSDAVVCFEFGYARSDTSVEAMVGAVGRILRHGCRTTRSLGSGVLDLCYVASGRMDVVYTGMAEEGWKPWDYCAGMVVVEEAGGIIRSLRGRPGGGPEEEFDGKGCIVKGSKFNIYSSSMVCGVNRTVVEECRNVVLGL